MSEVIHDRDPLYDDRRVGTQAIAAFRHASALALKSFCDVAVIQGLESLRFCSAVVATTSDQSSASLMDYAARLLRVSRTVSPYRAKRPHGSFFNASYGLPLNSIASEYPPLPEAVKPSTAKPDFRTISLKFC